MKRVIRYKAAPYGREVVLYLRETEFARAAAKAGHPSLPPEEAAGLTVDCGDGRYLVRVRDGLASTLVHECCHAALFILAAVGIDPVASSGEPMAYLLDHMVGHFLQHLTPASRPAETRPDGCSA